MILLLLYNQHFLRELKFGYELKKFISTKIALHIIKLLISQKQFHLFISITGKYLAFVNFLTVSPKIM